MKTLVLSMISIAATVAAMTACTSESDPIEDLNPKDAKVEIKLKTGVVDVTTKAADPTDGSDKTKFADNTKIQLLRWDAATVPTTLDWTKVSQVAATANGTSIVFGNSQYYPTNGDNTYFMGLYPAIDGTNVKLDTSTGKVSFKGLDGKTDILNAQLTDAGNNLTTAATNIQFSHVLSQVNINLKGNSIAQSTFGKITKISLSGVPNDITLTLGTDVPGIELGEPSNEDLVVMTSAGETLTSDGLSYSVMLPPSLGKEDANKITIKIETTGSENPLTVEVKDIDGGTQSGVANKINLTFKDKITVETGITDWQNSKNENGYEIANE